MDGERIDVRTPVLFVAGTPASAGDDFFGAELLLPSGVMVIESFPTVPLVHETAGASERYALALQVVPSLLRWRATRGQAPLLSFVAGVDVVLIVLIGLLALLGVRMLLRPS
jgi:hypothetical protein